MTLRQVKSNLDKEMDAWRTRRRRIFLTLNVADYMRDTGISDKEAALVSMHKAITIQDNLSEDVRLQSVEWLRRTGHTGFMGAPLPAEGVLP